MNYSTTPEFIIFSVYKTDQPLELNQAHHNRIKRIMTLIGLSFKEVDGVYKGSKEVSFLVLKSDKYEDIVKSICFDHRQESYLKVDADRQASLEYIGGPSVSLGKFRALTDGERLDDVVGYTVSNNIHYVCD